MKETDKIKKTLVFQHDESDCGVACLLSVIRFWGGENTLERLRELSGTSKQGTTLLGLCQAATQVGLETQGYEATTDDLQKQTTPLILHLTIESKYEHYVVCYGYQHGHFLIGDPGKGIVTYDRTMLERQWKSHVCMTLHPTDSFVLKRTIYKQKRAWFLDSLRQDFGLLGVSLLLGLIVSALGLVVAIFSQKLVDEILPAHDYRQLWTGLLLLGVLLSARIGISAIRQLILNMQSRDFNNRIIHSFYRRLLWLPRKFFDTRKIGDLVARLNDTRRIQRVVTNIAGNIIIDALTALTTIGLLFYYCWEIALLVAVSLPLFLFVVFRYNKPILESQRDVMASYSHSESNFINTMQGVDTIRSFNRQESFINLNNQVYGCFQEHIYKLGKVNIRLSVVVGFMTLVITLTTIAIGSRFVLSGMMKVGELMAVISLAGTITPSIVNLALVSIPINEAKVAFNRMFEFASTQPEDVDNHIPCNSPIKCFSLNRISFRFPGRKLMLSNVSIKFCRGDMNFIIGESGCGKTTLCHIIERSYQPESGKLMINNECDVNEISLLAWREKIGSIPQDVFVFNGTVLDNILLGVKDEGCTVSDVLKKCSKWGVDYFIGQLPQGYLTVVGEEGVNLSGGQKQLIALIRLLLKDPEIMLLDEPTSSMDREMELFTLNLLTEIKTNKILIIVSHRLHILKQFADKIVLIENGSITYAGNHEHIMSSNNLYSIYWKSLN